VDDDEKLDRLLAGYDLPVEEHGEDDALPARLGWEESE
jgi:hypothetical protein